MILKTKPFFLFFRTLSTAAGATDETLFSSIINVIRMHLPA